MTGYQDSNHQNHSIETIAAREPGTSDNLTRRGFLGRAGIGVLAVAAPGVLHGAAPSADRPNILWITSEDNSPYLGCYGDPLAQTPNLDRLAVEGVRFTHAYANAPVCSAARATLITGMYGISLGIFHHRSGHPVPDTIKPYPEYLREIGYYCTNNSKKDYNFKNDKNAWDESSNKAHYRKRKPGQPFFSIFNVGESHESRVFPPGVEKKRKSGEYPPEPRVHPDRIELPPYHPDLPEIRLEWADYYDAMTAMDAKVGELLEELESEGLAEDTIVFYYADHGGALARGKRFVYDSGTRVPMMIRFPKKWRHLAPVKSGQTWDRMVGFVDFPATLLSLTGVPVPKHMDGRAFLGEQNTEPRKHILIYRGRMDSRYDMVRAIRDKRYRYIKNYAPYRPYGQPYTYAENSRITPAWRKAYREGKCDAAQSAYWELKPGEELYDLENDPHEVRNLAADPAQAKRLEKMRGILHKEIMDARDVGFIPESMYAELAGEGGTVHAYAQSSAYDLERVKAVADKATSRDAAHLKDLVKAMGDDDPLVRYWGAIGAVVLKEKAAPAKRRLKRLLKDDNSNVRIAAAEALGYLGEAGLAVQALGAELDYDEKKDQAVYVYAGNALQYLDKKAVRVLLPKLEAAAKNKKYGYATRTTGSLAAELNEN